MERKEGEGMGRTINITNNRGNGEEGTIKGNKWKEKGRRNVKNINITNN